MNPGWTDWTPVVPALRLTPRVLAELLDGGQAFGWWSQPDGTWLGRWSHHVAALRLDADGTLQWRGPANDATLATTLSAYLGFGDDHQTTALDTLPWRSDPHLAACCAEFRGLRILRQPFAETLLGFLCSATKQIVQIKQMLTLLATRHGTPLPYPAPPNAHASSSDHFTRQLPTWEQLAAVPEAELRACLLGFRARYIKGTADFLATHPNWLEETATAPYAEARTRLCTLPGVGEKIADCVLLFGAGRLEAFPVDVWMIKAMARRYGLDDWKPTQVAHFGRVHFGTSAGLAQQYLFAYERAHRSDVR